MPRKLPALPTVLAAFVASAPTNSNAAVVTGKAFTSEAVRTTIQIKAQKSQINTAKPNYGMRMYACPVGGGDGSKSVGITPKPKLPNNPKPPRNMK